MMKKILLIVVVYFMFINLNAQEIKKVAVISISAKENLGSNIFVGGLVKDIINHTKSDFISTDALNAYHKFILNDLHQEFTFEFIDENVVINHETYKELKEKNANRILDIVNPEPLIGPDGYDIHPLAGKKQLEKYAEAFPETQAFLFVQLSLEIVPDKMIGNSGTAVVSACSKMHLLDKSARTLIDRSITGYSSGKFKVVAGQIVKGKDQIPEFLNEAVEDMYKKYPSSMPSIIKSYNKKVKKYYM